MDANIISGVSNKVISLVHNPKILILGVALILVTILIMYFIKKVIVNSIIGVIGFFILASIGIKLPLVLTLIITVVFGVGGLGAILILKFFGLF